MECLDILEELLSYHDYELLSHFKLHKVTSQIYAWLPMHTLFSENFTSQDWFQLWDHFLSNQPSFMMYFIIAYIRSFRTALLELEKLDDFKASFIFLLFFFLRKKKLFTPPK